MRTKLKKMAVSRRELVFEFDSVGFWVALEYCMMDCAYCSSFGQRFSGLGAERWCTIWIEKLAELAEPVQGG